MSETAKNHLNMAKQREYSDDRGVTYAESYWRISTIFIDVDSKNISFKFLGYKDLEARKSKKQTIGEFVVSWSQEDFDREYLEHVKNNKSLGLIGYELACARGVFKVEDLDV